jgi:hypothetical protein
MPAISFSPKFKKLLVFSFLLEKPLIEITAMIKQPAPVTFSLLPILLGVATSVSAANLGFENGDLSDWDTSGNASIQTSLFGSGPTEGSFQALLQTNPSSTSVFDPIANESLEGGNIIAGFLFAGSEISDYGLAQNPQAFYTQGSAIKTQATLNVNAGDVLKFDYNFLSDEDPQTTNFGNDFAFFSLNQELIPLTTVQNSAAAFIASSTSFAREIGYQSYSYTFTTSGNFILGFSVVDEFDFATKSGLLIDNIRVEKGGTLPTLPESSTLLSLGFLGLIGIRQVWRKR